MNGLAGDQVALSVVRDGVSSWVCRVDWPDGTHVYRERTFHVSGFPDVVITSEEQALECLAAWVQQRPQDWRKP